MQQSDPHAFRRSRAVVPVLEVLDEAGSTNDVLTARAATLPDLSVIVTGNQTGGRGRLGRVWVAPPGRTLAISVLLRPDGLAPEAFGWFPLLAGLAMSRAVAPLVPGTVAVKWPNDVLIDGAKVSGTLSELLPDLSGLVIGAGVNLSQEAEELPTETSTSLVLAGAESPDADIVLSSYLTQLTALYREYLTAGGDAVRSALRDEVAEACHTLGRAVRVELPGGDTLLGTAVGIDADGRLIVESETGRTAVAAGDVTHLRY
ncbi:biotin--[acetyl-CoA-carboxylase] ligase [Leifsonia sp. ZF2019]|uniref:biotin--[acetyl-CoA-carboxylase] ligase n=1 Tax=Leifsonia sp. ZF2019 TaxID=2781978 RepID=UPI001CBF2CB4|nr:biotin--[acetyl-CoA-carboxylase] ligase [Leifsonia sp. ZF2019]UAJ80540.1 biotin--[acetyl-CoA-carboxylase] ligase [Leifsonia sp. ZF2019]